MSRSLDYFFSFRSPYSYLVGPRAFALADRFDVEVALPRRDPDGDARPVRPAVEAPAHAARRQARGRPPRHALRPHPRPDRRGGDALPARLRARQATPDARASSCSRPAAGSGRRRSTSPATTGLRGLRARRARLGGVRGRPRGPGDARARRGQHRSASPTLGHWGVPVFVLDGELFWGQDRIEDVERALAPAARV